MDAIKKSVSDAAIAFRDGLVELFEFLEVTFVLAILKIMAIRYTVS